MLDVANETTEFVHLCETFYDKLAHETLPPEDRDLIKYSCIDLLNKLRSN
ncbi:MAG TPA: hypothetical protein VIW47_03165 [Nitrospiraceae bacterium]